jgi:hypothetical protein
MARDTTPEYSQFLLQGLTEHLHRSLCSSIAELIYALQERQLAEARRIAAELAEDLCLCDSIRCSYFLSRILSLISVEDVFSRCDELSAWLLFLEQELQRIHALTQAQHTSSTVAARLISEAPISARQANDRHIALRPALVGTKGEI